MKKLLPLAPRAPETYTTAEIDAAIDRCVPSAIHPTLAIAYEAAANIAELTAGRSGYFGIPFPALLPRLKARAEQEQQS